MLSIMNKTLAVLLSAAILISATGAISNVAVAASPASESAKIFFAPTNLTITDWATQAAAFFETGYEALIMDADGRTLGRITNGRVNAADSGYASGGQGVLDAFNDYRGVARATLRQGITPNGGTTAIPSGDSSIGSAVSAPDNGTQIDIEAYRYEVIRLTNLEREKAGLPALEIDQDAMVFAQIRAEELATHFSHQRPDGTTFVYLENGARGQRTPQDAVNAWMKSPAHRGGILENAVYAIGIGCYETPDGTMYWTQEFLW